jgi:hypothetical protein
MIAIAFLEGGRTARLAGLLEVGGVAHMLVYLVMNAVGRRHPAGKHAALARACNAGVAVDPFFLRYILARGAGLDVIWPQFLAARLIGIFSLRLRCYDFAPWPSGQLRPTDVSSG